jgi:copper chaperone CopZ
MKNIILIIALFVVGTAFSQTENQQDTVTIQTSAECDMCKDRLEGVLNYTKGVKFAELNLADKTLFVKFNPKKISMDEIRTIISETGYDADDVKANPTSVDELPTCCKPGGMK